ncbi:Biotin carboxyl carrier of acetyl-CoA carboxylase 2, chloroplastic -like protein [Gossypium arboreum]|uniref:Biotin carboxyl carrier protein of acetyl-CoA carboxylase n=1 Tax=Gossypium arboreum TaxID=29729 RepID=A0A0B0PJX5_GOSAR|nr:Biotin carboxyl carrier of acetyl-CoA carboxylase 2, chloroplastic -like protein [Gossypium arboreum]
MASSISVPCPKISSFVKPKQTQKISFALPPCSKSCFSFGSSIKVPAFSGCQRGQNAINAICHISVSNIRTRAQATCDRTLKWHNEKKTMAFKARAKLNEVGFMTEKLVDSRDITELQLKQSDCELIIRKKEALQPPEQAPPVFMPQYMPHHAMFQTPFPAAAPTAPPAPSNPAPPPLALPSAASPAKTSSSSHPPLKCPMAGTFYRSPAPGEPPFVKVGDKVQKGQVICIIEAMKLMNEIEADQSGTITEILAEDGKSVSVDMPLFVIVP